MIHYHTVCAEKFVYVWEIKLHAEVLIYAEKFNCFTCVTFCTLYALIELSSGIS